MSLKDADRVVQTITVKQNVKVEYVAWALWYHSQVSKFDAPPPSKKWVISFLREQMREFGSRDELLMGDCWAMVGEDVKEEAIKAAKALFNL